MPSKPKQRVLIRGWSERIHERGRGSFKNLIDWPFITIIIIIYIEIFFCSFRVGKTILIGVNEGREYKTDLCNRSFRNKLTLKRNTVIYQCEQLRKKPSRVLKC